MRAFIYANGAFCPSENYSRITEDDLVIAADGGSSHCQVMDIIPDVLIGDLDSISKSLLKEWEAAGVQIIRHPVEKDQTDLELALLHAQMTGAREIVVFGAVGGRLDMTFGNLLLLAHPELTGEITYICDKEEVRLLHSGESLSLHGGPGDTVSLISLLPGSSIITSEGLEYPLVAEDLEFGLTRGISNRMTTNRASIHLVSGLLVVIHTRNNLLEEV
ncbi:MAG: thiamine diphosphokinase [Anaerolineales bacterium]|nr:thiamine diphosphokinase [Anaerolineales bacterium]